jgi:hypothetical protein
MEGLAAREIGAGVAERWTDAIVTGRGRAFLRRDRSIVFGPAGRAATGRHPQTMKAAGHSKADLTLLDTLGDFE